VVDGSLHSNSQLDIGVKGAMVRDLLNLAGYMLPDKDDVVPNPSTVIDARYCVTSCTCIFHYFDNSLYGAVECNKSTACYLVRKVTE